MNNRQLRVGEQIKKILCKIFTKHIFHNKIIDGEYFFISEVRVSPDLKNARIYIGSMFDKNITEIIETLNLLSPKIRKLLAQELKIKFLPALYFVKDNSFAEAEKINKILQTIKK